MAEPTYPTARLVAPHVRAHFARRRAEGDAAGRTDLAPAPDAETIEALIDAAFWASLRREEGLTPRISLALLPPDDAPGTLKFDVALPLDPAVLAKIAPAVERPGIHLGAWSNGDGALHVWGTTRQLPTLCFVIETVVSGLLVIKQRGEPFAKFINVAVLEGDRIKMVDERSAVMPECPAVLRSLVRPELTDRLPHAANVLVDLAASMRAHGRGGTLVVVPEETPWRDSVVLPITYAVRPPYAGLSALLHAPADVPRADWQDDLRRAVDSVAGLTAVDGATLVSDGLEVLAFGAKLVRRRGQPFVERIVVSEPVEGTALTLAIPVQLGGTRHLSAAQFVHDQRGASALVASQDGRFTVFQWSSHEDAVHAHRIEALLL